MVDYSPPFANAATRREPTAGELSGGFPCGPADQDLFNWLVWANQSEIGNAIGASGQTPSNSDMTQLLVALSRGIYLGGVGGTANALTATVPGSVTIPALLEGMTFSFKAALNNTAGATLNITGFGAKSIVHKDGTALKADELQAGQIAKVTYDGTNFQFDVSYGRLLNIQTFTASGTYTPTPGMSFIRARVQGGGGAGAGATLPSAGNVSLGSPGTCGAYAEGKFTAAQVGASQAVTIGAAGAAVVGGAGGAGGSSSLGALISSPGGLGGGMLNNASAPNVNGTGNFTALPTGGNILAFSGGAENASLAVSASNGYGAPGGSSILGKGGPAIGINANGANASGYGAGGTGCLISNGGGGNFRGGNGTPGIIIIEEYSL